MDWGHTRDSLFMHPGQFIDLGLDVFGSGFLGVNVARLGGDWAFTGIADVVKPTVGADAAMFADQAEERVGMRIR